MTAQELIDELKKFHPNDEVKVKALDELSGVSVLAAVDRVAPIRGGKCRVLIEASS